jgi:hypothetical protein
MDTVLLVTDPNVDAREVVAAATRSAGELNLLVPARLHGLAWMGDPHASYPAARRRLGELERLATEAGLAFEHASVGDPDPATAVLDELALRKVDSLLVCERGAGRSPFDLARRLRRLTGLPVERVSVRAAPREVEVRPAPRPPLSAATPV